MAKGIENISNKFIGAIERGGNALPHPAALFGIFGLITILVSGLGHLLGWNGLNPATGETVGVINLVSKDGLHRIILGMVDSYTGFAPLGIVMVALLGISVADRSGLINTAISAVIQRAPARSMTFIIVFAGILSNVALTWVTF